MYEKNLNTSLKEIIKPTNKISIERYEENKSITNLNGLIESSNSKKLKYWKDNFGTKNPSMEHIIEIGRFLKNIWHNFDQNKLFKEIGQSLKTIGGEFQNRPQNLRTNKC